MSRRTKVQTINVFGEEESDPICDFQNCYHTFSIHGNRSHQLEYNCVCKHPTNSALGVNKEVINQ